LIPANFSAFCRTASIEAVRPKISSSGGKSPTEDVNPEQCVPVIVQLENQKSICQSQKLSEHSRRQIHPSFETSISATFLSNNFSHPINFQLLRQNTSISILPSSTTI
jgi:hypothetical protein